MYNQKIIKGQKLLPSLLLSALLILPCYAQDWEEEELEGCPGARSLLLDANSENVCDGTLDTEAFVEEVRELCPEMEGEAHCRIIYHSRMGGCWDREYEEAMRLIRKIPEETCAYFSLARLVEYYPDKEEEFETILHMARGLLPDVKEMDRALFWFYCRNEEDEPLDDLIERAAERKYEELLGEFEISEDYREIIEYEMRDVCESRFGRMDRAIDIMEEIIELYESNYFLREEVDRAVIDWSDGAAEEEICFGEYPLLPVCKAYRRAAYYYGLEGDHEKALEYYRKELSTLPLEWARYNLFRMYIEELEFRIYLYAEGISFDEGLKKMDLVSKEEFYRIVYRGERRFPIDMKYEPPKERRVYFVTGKVKPF